MVASEVVQISYQYRENIRPANGGGGPLVHRTV